MTTGYLRDFILYDLNHESVRVTGSWCNWDENAHKLTKIPNLYWIASVHLPYGEKISYKYIIDGEWKVNPQEQTETDERGLANNVFYVPKESEVPAGLLGSTTSAAKEPITEGAAHESTPSGPVVATTHNGTTASPSSPVAKSASPIAGGVQGVEKVAPNVTQASASGTGVSVNDLAKPSVSSGSDTTHAPASSANGAHTGQSSGAAAIGAGALLGAVGIGGAAASSAKSGEKAPEKVISGGSGSSTSVNPATGAATATTATIVGGPSSTSHGSSAKAPLPASTKDAPVLPSSIPASSSQGIFSAISHLATSAVAAVEQAAESVVAKIEGAAVHPSAEATPVLPVTRDTAASTKPTAAPSGTTVGTADKAADAKAALAPIASSNATAAVSKEMSRVTLDDTKKEVTGAVEALGAAITSGISALGVTSPATGSAVPQPAFTSAAVAPPVEAKSGPAVPSSTTSSSGAPQLPPVTGFGGPIYPTDGSSPAPVKIAEPEQHHTAAKTGTPVPAKETTSANPASVASGPAKTSSTPAAPSTSTDTHPVVIPAVVNESKDSSAGKKSGEGIAEKLKKKISRGDDKKADAPVAPTATTTTTSTTSASKTTPAGQGAAAAGVGKIPETKSALKTPTSTLSKKDTSSLGKGQAPVPVTPQKTSANAANGTPATGTSDKYATAPSTPATPATTERKRKSSFFQKVKHAFSPSNK